MPLNTLKDLLIGQLHELYAGERHGLQVIPKLEKAATAPDLAAALRKHAEQSRTHVDRLEQALDDLQVKPRRTESAGMKGLLADAIALAQDKRAEPHVRDAAVIAAAQHVEHDEIAGYGCARTWARLLGQSAVEKLLQKSLDEEKQSDARLSRLADSLNRAAMEPATV